MTAGIDTDFLVAVEVGGHPFHQAATALKNRCLDDGIRFAVAPQTLAEFVHVVTDPRRMPKPLSSKQALARATFWWNAEEIVHAFPDAAAVDLFLGWMAEHRLGRKRLLDTLLAATFRARGIRAFITNNRADFIAFGFHELLSFPAAG